MKREYGKLRVFVSHDRALCSQCVVRRWVERRSARGYYYRESA